MAIIVVLCEPALVSVRAPECKKLQETQINLAMSDVTNTMDGAADFFNNGRSFSVTRIEPFKFVSIASFS